MAKNSAYDHGLGTGKEQSLYQKTKDKMPDAFAWNGLLSAYQKVGFKITAQSSPSKFLVRYDL